MEMDLRLLANEIGALAKGWYGYGRWSAPYWFLGMEPGGEEGDTNLRRWNELGRAELVDVVAHHETHTLDWFGETCSTQSTWAKLIWLLLTYKGVEPTRDATLHYQRHELGRKDRETTLLELSAFAAASTAVRNERTLHRDHRIRIIRERVLQYNPIFVVFYSTHREYSKAWETIAGTPLDEGIPKVVGSTVFLMTYHPQYKRGKQYWKDMAQVLLASNSGNVH